MKTELKNLKEFLVKIAKRQDALENKLHQQDILLETVAQGVSKLNDQIDEVMKSLQQRAVTPANVPVKEVHFIITKQG